MRWPTSIRRTALRRSRRWASTARRRRRTTARWPITSCFRSMSATPASARRPVRARDATTPMAFSIPNPYAADDRTAQAFVRSTRPRTVSTSSRALRGVLGIEGSFGDDWRYSANFTASEVRLKRTQDGYYIPQRIMDAVASGQLNFNELEATPQDRKSVAQGKGVY